MPALHIDLAALVVLRWQVVSLVTTNVLGAMRTGTVTYDQALANALDTAVKAAFTANLAARFSPSAQLTSVGIRDINTPNNAEFIGVNAPVAGTGTGDPLPKQVALCVTLRTLQTGPAHRGRVYLHGFSEAENDPNGLATTAAQTSAAAFINAVDSALLARGLQLAVLSRPVPAQIIPARAEITIPGRAGQAQDVSSVQVRNGRWDTQRRRVRAP